MNFSRNTSSFVTASFYPTSFYPSVTKAVAFQILATQLSESRTRMGVDCLNDRQVFQKMMLFAAVVGLIAIISALFTTVLEFPRKRFAASATTASESHRARPMSARLAALKAMR